MCCRQLFLPMKKNMILTPTYHVMEMYNVHQDATMIPLQSRVMNTVLGMIN